MSNAIDPTSQLPVSLLCMRSSKGNFGKETKQNRKKENEYLSDKYWVRIKNKRKENNQQYGGMLMMI